MVEPLSKYRTRIKEIFGDYNSKILSFIHEKLKDIGYITKPTHIKDKDGNYISGYNNLSVIFSNGIINNIANNYFKLLDINRQKEDEIEWNNNTLNHTMSDANNELLNKYQFESKKIIRITESQYNKLLQIMK